MKRLTVSAHPTPDATEILASFELENGTPQNVTVRTPDLVTQRDAIEAKLATALESVKSRRETLDAEEAAARATFEADRAAWADSVFTVAEKQYQAAVTPPPATS